MTPEEIIEEVKKTCAHDVDMTLRDMDMLQRYFIKEYCRWLPLRTIAKLTGVKHHTAVQSSVLAVMSKSKYIVVKALITQRIEDRILRTSKALRA
jgi:hypothetical protein